MKQRKGPFPRGRIVDMRGWRFGRLRVLFKIDNAWDGHPFWLCWCDCGNLHMVRSGNLRSGRTKSCGCLFQETRFDANKTHGRSTHPLYNTWLVMLQKCYLPGSDHYARHGGRGIGVCDEWREPRGILTFIEDMEPRPEGHFLTLIDMTEDFSPANCAWVPAGDKARRTAPGRPVTWQGETRPLYEWAEILAIPERTLRYRIDNWDLDRAMTQPLRTWKPKGRPRKRKAATG